jgi:malic enzyme
MIQQILIWVLGLGGVGYFIARMFAHNMANETQQKIFTEQQDAIIKQKDTAIEQKKIEVKADVDEYFKKQAEWRAARGNTSNKPTSGSGTPPPVSN